MYVISIVFYQWLCRGRQSRRDGTAELDLLLPHSLGFLLIKQKEKNYEFTLNKHQIKVYE